MAEKNAKNYLIGMIFAIRIFHVANYESELRVQ